MILDFISTPWEDMPLWQKVVWIALLIGGALITFRIDGPVS